MLSLLLFASLATSQFACSVSGPAGYSGPVTPQVIVTCAGDTSAPPPPVTPPPVVTACDPSQTSAGLSVTLHRQCHGTYSYYQGSGAFIPNSGTLVNLDDILTGSWGNYFVGTVQFQMQAGYYWSLAFTPQANASLQFTANTSWGDGGQISVSTTPGNFGAGAVCTMSAGGRNGSTIGAYGGCPVVAGQHYYLNLANVKPVQGPLSYTFNNL